MLKSLLRLSDEKPAVQRFGFSLRDPMADLGWYDNLHELCENMYDEGFVELDDRSCELPETEKEFFLHHPSEDKLHLLQLLCEYKLCTVERLRTAVAPAGAQSMDVMRLEPHFKDDKGQGYWLFQRGFHVHLYREKKKPKLKVGVRAVL